jgi:hypothetical protein
LLQEILVEENSYLSHINRLKVVMRTSAKEELLVRLLIELGRYEAYSKHKMEIMALPDYQTKLMSLVIAAKALLKDAQDDKNYEALLVAAESL